MCLTSYRTWPTECFVTCGRSSYNSVTKKWKRYTRTVQTEKIKALKFRASVKTVACWSPVNVWKTCLTRLSFVGTYLKFAFNDSLLLNHLKQWRSRRFWRNTKWKELNLHKLEGTDQVIVCWKSKDFGKEFETWDRIYYPKTTTKKVRSMMRYEVPRTGNSIRSSSKIRKESLKWYTAAMIEVEKSTLFESSAPLLFEFMTPDDAVESMRFRNSKVTWMCQ